MRSQRDPLGEVYEEFKTWDIGDVLGAEGVLFKTKTGELSVRVEKVRLLTKSLRPLPDKWHGLSDQETRYRQRYVDLIISPESRAVFQKRTRIVRFLRDFLDSLGHDVCGTCDSVGEALEHAERGGFDLAILDVNLKGENVWPVAEKLREKGVPFVIASGGHVDPPPAQFASVPVIEKPYTVDRVTPAIDAALSD